jgi:putative ABC transport system permease protein
MLSDYFAIAIGSLHKRFLRTSLTMIGIFIGIAAVVALISLGQGMKDAINQQFANVGTDKVLIQGATAGFSPPGQNAAGKIGRHDLDVVKRVPGVAIAAGRLLRSVSVEHAGNSGVFFAASLPEEAESRGLVIRANNLKTVQGRLLKQGDRNKLIVGSNLWMREKFPKPVVIGTKLLVNGEEFEVIGLMPKISAGIDDVVMINEDALRNLLSEPDEFSIIIAQAARGIRPASLADMILRAIRRDRHQKEGFEDVSVSTSEEIIRSVNVVLGVVQAVFVGIALISLIVGGIGIMNTMYTSVLERTRDIGIMKAIGARNSDILVIFLLESGLLGMCGGAVGIIIGIGLSKSVELIARGTIGDVIQASFHPVLVIGALAFSFVVGVVSGVLPARQAGSLQPVAAMRGG